MKTLTPSMRLKVNRDTFYLPDTNKGMYFRNNLSSFRMEGNAIVQWIEMLLPMFNGEHTLKDLTAGLSVPYQKRVMDIAEVLFKNGFVRDVSQDLPHQLADQVLEKYASQIEFLDHLGGSGAYRYQTYRQMKILAIGSGPFLISLVSALLESGLPKFHVLITNSVPTNRQRLKEIVEHACKTDLEVTVEEVFRDSKDEISLKELVHPYDSIIYVSQEGDVERLRDIHKACRQEKKIFIPALFLHQVGIAGPLVKPKSVGCWESAWRSIHKTALGKEQQFETSNLIAESLLANVIVFELFKEITGVSESEPKSQFYLLNTETLEGSWHSFAPHPLVTGNALARQVQELDKRIEPKSSNSDSIKWLMYFSQLTSKQSGIFHSWEEGDLPQLPLAQCYVQVVNPKSEGPAELLPKITSAALTHEEARREAGLSGIEMYVSQTITIHPTIEGINEQHYIGIGAGGSFAESIYRGVQKCLDDEFRNQQWKEEKHPVIPVKLISVEDEQCQYYLQALKTMQQEPKIGLGRAVYGFPVVWVGTNDDSWHGSVGLNMTTALRSALQETLQKLQNKEERIESPSVSLEEMVPLNIPIPVYDLTRPSKIVHSATKVLEQNHIKLHVLEIECEPFLKEKHIYVSGVLLRKEESR